MDHLVSYARNTQLRAVVRETSSALEACDGINGAPSFSSGACGGVFTHGLVIFWAAVPEMSF